jgi:peptidoglycan/LPS O-acetylase OafA/YrhL
LLKRGGLDPIARNTTVDLLRGLAAFGIVWFHAGAPYSQIALSGLTIFLALLILLHAGPDRAASRIISQKADRLVRPWIIWSSIFVLAKFAQALIEDQSLSSEFESRMLLTGPSLHLWFLPFGFVLVVALTLVERHISLSQASVFSCLLVAGVPALPVAALAAPFVRERPWTEWLAAMTPVLLALALRSAAASVSRRRIVSAATISSAILTFHLLGKVELAVPLGMVLVIFALNSKIGESSWGRWIGMISMPVYLIHPIFLSLLKTGPLFRDPTTIAVAATLLSAAVGEAIRRLGLSPKLL